jgi:two-component system, NarL family, response regulator LiaR
MSDLIRILIADDHPVVRDGLAMILGTQADFEVVGAAGNGNDTVSMTRQLEPDVLLLDLEMPGLDGLETLHQLRAICPDIPVLVFTAYDTDERIVGAVQAGAKGYLLKGSPRAELFTAIRTIAAGGTLLQPIIATKLMRHLSEQRDNTTEALTEREMDVLRLLARGSTNREIAAELVITERTVKFHLTSIMGKLGATNRTEALAIAAQRGLVSLNSE